MNLISDADLDRVLGGLMLPAVQAVFDDRVIPASLRHEIGHN